MSARVAWLLIVLSIGGGNHLYGAPPGEGRWSVGAGVLMIVPASEQAAIELGPEVPGTLGIDSGGPGFELSAEYRLGERLILELGAGMSDLDVDITTENGSAVESTTFEIYSLGADWIVIPERSWTLRVGVFIAQSKLDDVIFTHDEVSSKFTFDDDYGFGVGAGFDWPIRGSRWALSGKIRYLDTILESDSGSADLNLDPLLFVAGVKYRR